MKVFKVVDIQTNLVSKPISFKNRVEVSTMTDGVYYRMRVDVKDINSTVISKIFRKEALQAKLAYVKERYKNVKILPVVKVAKIERPEKEGVEDKQNLVALSDFNAFIYKYSKLIAYADGIGLQGEVNRLRPPNKDYYVVDIHYKGALYKRGLHRFRVYIHQNRYKYFYERNLLCDTTCLSEIFED